MTGLVPVEPNHILLHNAALVAQARRKPYNTRIRHWLEDVMEQHKTPEAAQVHDDDDYFHLSPLSRSIAEFRDSIYFCDSRRNSIIKLSPPSSLSDATTALNSKPSLDKLDSRTSYASSIGSFGCHSDPETLLPPPRLCNSREIPNDRARPRPRLSIKIHRSPLTTKYSLERRTTPVRTNSRLSTSPIPSGSLLGIPKFELYTFPEPPSAVRRRRVARREGYAVPAGVRCMSPRTAARMSSVAPQPRAAIRTARGTERARLPRTANTTDPNKMRLAAARMAKKSDRMLAAALRERAEQDRNGFVLDDRRRLQRLVMAQAAQQAQKGFATTTIVAAGPAAMVSVPRHRSLRARASGSVSSKSASSGRKEVKKPRSSGNARMAQRERELGFKPAGVISRDWNTMGGYGRAL